MNNFTSLLDEITTTYKQKLFGKYLQGISKYNMFDYSKNCYFIINDDDSILQLYSFYLAKKYIYKDISLTILNSSKYKNNEINIFDDKDIKIIKISSKLNNLDKIISLLKVKKLYKKNSSFIYSTIFDEEITYTLYNILYKGKLLGLRPIEKEKNYYIFRPGLLLQERDIKYILNKYDGEFDLFRSFDFKQIEKEKLDKTYDLILDIKKTQNQAGNNIYDAINNVILDKVLSYKKGKEKVSFLDTF